jgi:quercetin dioxygenase-like cupin family protein
MDVDALRDRSSRLARLEEDALHLFALDEMVRAMRTEHVYQANGHTALLLLKGEHLRVVLGVAASGTEIGEHAVRGPTVVHVLSGALEVGALEVGALEVGAPEVGKAESPDAMRTVRAGEMIVIPHDRSRALRATADTSFVWALSLENE